MPGSLVRRAGYFLSGVNSVHLKDLHKYFPLAGPAKSPCVRRWPRTVWCPGKSCGLRPDADTDSSSSTSLSWFKFPDLSEIQPSHLYDGKSGTHTSGQSGGNDTVRESSWHTAVPPECDDHSVTICTGKFVGQLEEHMIWRSMLWVESWTVYPPVIYVNWARSMNSWGLGFLSVKWMQYSVYRA